MAEEKATLQAVQHMRLFRYSARHQETGEIHKGEQSGASAYAVRSALRSIGLDVEDIKEIPQRQEQSSQILQYFQENFAKRKRKQREHQRADLFDALATMLDAGMPLEQALHNLATAGNRRKQEQYMLQQLRDRIREGVALSDACERFDDWFDAIDAAMIRAGQHAGELPLVLRSLSEFLQQRSGMQHQVIAALIYPAILLCAAIGVTLFLSVHTLPQLMHMLEGADLQIPALTQIVAGGGQFVWQWWWAIALGCITLFAAFKNILHRLPTTHKCKQWLSSNIISRTLQRNRVAQVAITLARLQHSGIPLAEALDIVSQSAPSEALRSLLYDAANAIREGDDFSNVMRTSQLLDNEFAQLLQLGEESGELPDMFERIAERYERAAQRSTETLAAFLEPVSVFLLACLIGCIAMAAVLPLLEMTKVL